MQALSSILPISHIPALPAVLRLAGGLIPLEKALGLKYQALEDEPADKRTWRDGVARKEEKEEVWTIGDILEGWADERGFSQSPCPFIDGHQR